MRRLPGFQVDVGFVARPRLVNSSDGQVQLFGYGRQGRRMEGVVQPLHQIAAAEEIYAQHGGQVGQGPGSLGEVMEPLQQRQGQQGCPDLNAQGVLRDAHEDLHFEVLSEGLEEQPDLPTLAVDFGDGGGAEFQMVGQEDDLRLVVLVLHHDAPQPVRALLRGSGAHEADDLAGQDVVVLGHGPCFDDVGDGVVLHVGDEEDALQAGGWRV